MKNLRTKRGRIYTPTGAIVLILLTYKTVSVQSVVQKVVAALIAAAVALWTTELASVLFVAFLVVMDFAYGIRANRTRGINRPIRTQAAASWKLTVEFVGILLVFIAWSNLWVHFAWVQLVAYAMIGWRLTTSFLSKLDQAGPAFEVGHWINAEIRRRVIDSQLPEVPGPLNGKPPNKPDAAAPDAPENGLKDGPANQEPL